MATIYHMSGLCVITIIKSKDYEIMQTVMLFSFLSKECNAKSFQVLWTLQAQGYTATEQEGAACQYTLP